ncbi:MAG: flavodoxin family protein [Candidatus Methanofastidiosa archaeon]|jgi:flavodoxin|nr:flavodoxin family protein [Candidatus Methanofastidiosa archaeon]
MDIAVIYASYHHHNTRAVASAMADEVGADLFSVNEAPRDLSPYGLVCFGSGIYAMRHHRSLIRYVASLPAEHRDVAIFSTSGLGWKRLHRDLRGLVQGKGFHIVGEYACRAYDTFGPLRLIGGINRGRPSASDLSRARAFIRGVARYEEK